MFFLEFVCSDAVAPWKKKTECLQSSHVLIGHGSCCAMTCCYGCEQQMRRLGRCLLSTLVSCAAVSDLSTCLISCFSHAMPVHCHCAYHTTQLPFSLDITLCRGHGTMSVREMAVGVRDERRQRFQDSRSTALVYDPSLGLVGQLKCSQLLGQRRSKSLRFSASYLR